MRIDWVKFILADPGAAASRWVLGKISLENIVSSRPWPAAGSPRTGEIGLDGKIFGSRSGHTHLALLTVIRTSWPLSQIFSHLTHPLAHKLRYSCVLSSLSSVRTRLHYTTPYKFENKTITGHSVFVFEENLGMGNHLITIVTPSTLRFQNVFCSHKNQTTDVFKFLRFEERFQRAPFSWRISVDGRSNCSCKVEFSNSSGLKSAFSKKLHLRDGLVWTVGA